MERELISLHLCYGAKRPALGGVQIFTTNYQMCHGPEGMGNGTIAAFLIKKKPVDLTSDVGQSKDDGTLFLTISNGSGSGFIPAWKKTLPFVNVGIWLTIFTCSSTQNNNGEVAL
jgi:hypothetical protein